MKENMNNEQIEELKRLAEAATPGPWRFETRAEYPADYNVFAGEESIMEDTSYYPSAPGQNDAQFIAAANPAAVLELIAELARLRAAPVVGEAVPIVCAQCDGSGIRGFPPDDYWACDCAFDTAPHAAKEAGKVDIDHPVIGMLLEVARLAYDAMDNTEEDDSGAHWNPSDLEALSEAMNKLEELPDDQPGIVMGPAAKAQWALARTTNKEGN